MKNNYSSVVKILFLWALIGTIYSLIKPVSDEHITAQIQKKIYEIENLLQASLKQSENIFLDTSFSENERFLNIFSGIDEDINVFVYKNDSLTFWSTHKVLHDNFIESDSVYFKNYKNGWYLIKKESVADYDFLCSYLVKNEFAYENAFLKNSFNNKWHLNNISVEINTDALEPNILRNKEGAFLFSIKNVSQSVPVNKQIWVFTLSVLLIFLVFNLLAEFIKNYILNLPYAFVYLSVVFSVILGLRYVSWLYKAPAFLYEFEIFSPALYAASSIFPSLGDLILNAVSFFFIISIFSIFKKKQQLFLKNKISHLLFYIAWGVICVLLFYQIFALFKGFILNSNINLLFNNLHEINFYSFAGFFSIALLFYAFHLVSNIFISQSVIYNSKAIFIITVVVLTLILFLLNHFCVFLAIAFLGYVLWNWLYQKNILTLHKTSFIAGCIMVLSVISTYYIFKFSDIKEKDRRQLLALNLASETDPLAEFLFFEMQNDIFNDTVLKGLITSHIKNENAINTYLKQKYFSGYWNSFNIQITVCSDNDNLFLKTEDIEVRCVDFFKEMINNYGRSTSSPYFFQLEYLSGRHMYLADIPFFNESSNSYTSIYIELLSKFIPKQLGYPELLIDKNVRINTVLFNYDYAKYRQKELVQQYGKYHYSTKAGANIFTDLSFNYYDLNGYNHLHYTVSTDFEIIISKKNPTLIDYFALFSYVFLMLSLLWSVVTVFLDKYIHIKIGLISLSNRVKYAMIFLALMSFLVIGLFTYYHINNIYSNKNADNISEKAHSILIELEHKLAHHNSNDTLNHEYIHDLLIALSNVFFTDINLYTQQGDLIASSREKIFNEGLTSKKMNAWSFYQMTYGKKTFFMHKEYIGKLNYLSAYIPLRNFKNETLAYINLPYFAKQAEQQKEIAAFSAAFVNIYLFLIALALLMALLISKYVSNPLRLIKEKLSRFELGKKNEKILWKGSDEIGNLIFEYNRLIDELDRSASLLAKSERESAWREMAKQVAHEIKNPLTPMKLSVQYLQKAWHDQTEDFDLRLKRFTAMMIDQIDTLSDIAGSFSDFAKMPISQTEQIDLKTAIIEALSVYENTEAIKFVNHIDNNKTYFIYADNKQLKRAFNNLLKNAIQALQNKPDGLIEVSITENENDYVVRINDNGSGIPDTIKDKVFTPSFTTKTSGMGLGLAIVKSIVEGFEGQVYFETELNIGTSFFIQLSKNQHFKSSGFFEA